MPKRASLNERMKDVAKADPEPSLFPTPEPSAPARGRAKTREGKKLLLTPIDPELHKQVRHLAIDDGVTVEALVLAALQDYVAKRASSK